MTTTPPGPNFLVLHEDGRIIVMWPAPGQSLRGAIAQQVPNLSTQGCGPVRLWFADDFGAPGLSPNRLADAFIAQLGYQHTWYGPVAVSMEEDAAGDIPPLSPKVHALAAEWATAPADDDFAAAERHVPDLVGDLMYMGRLTLSGRTIYQYKHYRTRRYLSLDLHGRAWQIHRGATGQIQAHPIDLATATAFVLG